MMRQKDDFSPDPRWETLASMWFSELGISIDLHTAASIGDVDGVKQWIAKGADLNALNRGGWTALMYAAYLGHEQMCTLLLRNSGQISIDARSRDRQQTALMLAASCGSENTVGLLLKLGASVDAIDNRGRSALHYATDCNHAQVVRQLLIAGADPNLPSKANEEYSKDYLTPFQLACTEGLDVIVQYFLQCGAAENSTTAESARSVATRNGRTQIAMMIDSYEKGGGKGFKLEDKAHFNRNNSVLEGPNAISSLMKLQCKLASNDSNCRPPEKDHHQSTPRGTSRMEDYEKTLTVEQHSRPKNIDELLDMLELTKYLPVFKEKNVDLEKLLTLNGEELKEIGIKLFGPRKKILNAIERWHQNVPLTGIL